jgi:hypothetical protein
MLLSFSERNLPGVSTMPNATVGADAPASPKSVKFDDEYLRLQAGKIVADVLLEDATRKKVAEAAEAAKAEAAEAEEPKIRASKEFEEAYYAWLAAKAALQSPEMEEEAETVKRYRAETAAERRLFSLPAGYAAHVWQKLQAFEVILGEELESGQRTHSVILLALGSIKQDIVNLDMCS